MTTLSIDLPEEAFSALRRSPPEFAEQRQGPTDIIAQALANTPWLQVVKAA